MKSNFTKGGKQLATASWTCCEGVFKAKINCLIIGLTFGSFGSKCLAKEPIKITTDCLASSYFRSFGALSRNSSKTGSRSPAVFFPKKINFFREIAYYYIIFFKKIFFFSWNYHEYLQCWRQLSTFSYVLLLSYQSNPEK